MKVNLNFKINSDVAYQLDITKDYPNEILYISKKYNLKIKDIYICNHPCGEATIFSLENGKTNKWLGYIDENFYLEKTLFEIGMTEDEYYEECKNSERQKVGICPLCKRDLIEGPSINEHHFVPKSKGGKADDKILIHRSCHDFLHRRFTENELARIYNSPEKCLEDEDVKNYMTWIKKKDPEFIDKIKVSNKKKR